MTTDSIDYEKGRLLRGVRVQARVIGALIMREIHTRYGRENVGLIWLFLEPLILASLIAALHSRTGHYSGGDIKPVPLSVIGYVNFMLFRSLFNRAESALESNIPLMYHRTVTIFDVLLARALLEAAGTWVAFALLMGLIIVIGGAGLPARPLTVLVGMFLMLTLSFGLSMVVCSISYDNRSIGRMMHPLSYIMMPLSGAFFTMHSLPESIRNIFLSIPFAHVFEILRYGWFKTAHDEYIDPLYLGGWLLGSLLVGLLLLATTRSRIQMA